jgi:flagellar assembly protein FliH
VSELIALIDAAQRQVRALAAPETPTLRDPAEVAALQGAGALLREARELHQRALREANALREAARAEGYEAGLAALNGALLTAQAHHGALVAQAEPELLEVALALARRIAGEWLEADPARVAALAAHALTLARGRRRVLLRAHPDDLPHLERALPALELAAEGRVQLQPDPGVSPRSCHIDTEAGFIEVELDAQARALAAALGVRPPEQP